jgi:hypothetical protein
MHQSPCCIPNDTASSLEHKHLSPAEHFVLWKSALASDKRSSLEAFASPDMLDFLRLFCEFYISLEPTPLVYGAVTVPAHQRAGTFSK